MKITLVACGSRGDVQPMLALALGLQGAGHEVLLTVPPEHATRVEPHGCPVRPLGAGFEDNPVFAGASARAFGRFIKQELQDEIRELPEIARGTDLVLATGLVFGVPSVAEHLGVPYRMVTFAPVAMLGTSRDPLWIRLAAWAARVATNAGFKRLLNGERARLGLAPVSDVLASWAGERAIAASDPALTRLPAGAIPKTVQTAYMHLPSSGKLGPELQAFLEAGPPPVYVGFGSMPIERAAAVGRMLGEVARRLQRRLVVLSSGATLDALAGDPLCLVIGDEPHDQLFPRVAAVVHHGGAGTVATAARAGVPQIVAPVLADQTHWRRQVTQLGLGPHVAGMKRLSARSLAGAISECLSNPAYAERARETASKLEGTDGVALTVELIESDYRRAGDVTGAGPSSA